MLEFLFEFIAYVIFDCLIGLIIAPILKAIFRFLNISVVDKSFNFLAKILAIGLIFLIIYFIWFLF